MIYCYHFRDQTNLNTLYSSLIRLTLESYHHTLHCLHQLATAPAASVLLKQRRVFFLTPGRCPEKSRSGKPGNWSVMSGSGELVSAGVSWCQICKCQGWGRPRVWEYSQINAVCGVSELETRMQLSDRRPALCVIKVLLTNIKNEVLWLSGFNIDHFFGFSNLLRLLLIILLHILG